jgi:hypothetical protein
MTAAMGELRPVIEMTRLTFISVKPATAPLTALPLSSSTLTSETITPRLRDGPRVEPLHQARPADPPLIPLLQALSYTVTCRPMSNVVTS